MPSTKTLDFNKRLGEAVRARRIIFGFTQEALGNQLNVSFQQVQKYERGTNRISVENLLVIAKALGTTYGQLIDAAAAEVEQPAELPQPKPPGERMRLEAMQCLSTMPENRQRVAANVIRALAGEAA